MAEPITPEKWAQKFAAQPMFERYGAFTHRDLPKLEVRQIADLSLRSGIHPDVLGPCRRAAARLNWIIMFRPIKVTAMQHVGEFAKLPKPEAVKVKADPETGLVKLPDQRAFETALKTGDIDPTYAKKHELRLDKGGCLVNKNGQKFFSDMDLYEVLNGTSGRRVRLGSGDTPTGGLRNRRELDILINILRPLGTSFALIQHGPELQWYKHDHQKPNMEAVTAFCPDGEVLVIPPMEVARFIATVGSKA